VIRAGRARTGQGAEAEHLGEQKSPWRGGAAVILRLKKAT
jgi:hypothetical protein